MRLPKAVDVAVGDGEPSPPKTHADATTAHIAATTHTRRRASRPLRAPNTSRMLGGEGPPGKALVRRGERKVRGLTQLAIAHESLAEATENQNAWIEVDLAAAQQNVRELKALLGDD